MTLRLQKIVEAIPRVTTLADVGCDHGYIGLGALNSGVATKVIFVDISAPSLDKARQNCGNTHLAKCKFICQDGLQNICCDCAVIAGMGGLETISILQNAQTLPRFVVLQPMKNQIDVRKFLVDNNYQIELDVKFFDGKFYDLILAKLTKKVCPLSPLDLQFGLTNLQNPSADFIKFLNLEKQKYTQILTQCNDEEVQEKLKLVNSVLAQI